MHIALAPYPTLDARAFVTDLGAPLAQLPSPEWLVAGLSPDAATPLWRDEPTRLAIRDLLRRGGYKPTGRGKPASEYLARTANQGALGSINLVVDACNVVSLHSGLPISVVDLDRVTPPLRVGVAAPGSRYTFNASGQEIDVGGLLCLFDAQGPTANAVKDAQRSKTSGATRRTLSVVWGHRELGAQVDAALSFYRALLARAGAETTPADLSP